MNNTRFSPFDEPITLRMPPHQRHSDTSHVAAVKVKPKAATLRSQVLEYLRACKGRGATDEEMQHALNMNPSTQRPRRIELVKSFDVVDSGLQRWTKSGRRAAVWLAT